ncbi:MAG: UDP-galactopyranose mutase [Patescibacteria group bacterium]|nr:UDP-galactopyranose mutase [Patescibacteria group bacterium]
MLFDVIVVGAGFAGSVIAERCARVLGKRVLIIEKRAHIGGNAYDCYDDHGILIHQYGPHIFHTNQKFVIDYLSNFTTWIEYQHRVQALIDGSYVPLPFNLNTIQQLFPQHLAMQYIELLIQRVGFGKRTTILQLRELSSEPLLQQLAEFVYQKVFLNYTLKQWELRPEELNPTVTGRVPVVISYDDRYFADEYQMMPKSGYTAMFHKMLSDQNIHYLLNTDYQDIVKIDFINKKIQLFGQEFSGLLVYTGKIDEFFGYCFGELPYRSLHFAFEHLPQIDSYQKVGTVNYPNDYSYTRITEFKKITQQRHSGTTIVREYPQRYDRHKAGADIPYYPLPQPTNEKLYQQYKNLAATWSNVIFVGRLAEYRYYDMHHVVARALHVFEKEILPKFSNQ